MSAQFSQPPAGPEQYRRKKSWLFWVVFALILICIPVNFMTSSINPMQVELEECNTRMEMRQTPGNTLPAYSIEEFNRCADAGGKASTYFFLASLMILFNATALEGLVAMKKRAAIAYAAGLVYVTTVSLVMSGKFPEAFILLNLPIVLLLFWLVQKKQLV